tara:strand:+ start:1203 stop:2117 length:915 start_codon:yes stop_codon:yes gene_type:complete
MDSDSKVFVAGHRGLVGSAIIRNLEKKSYKNVYWISRDNCDLRNKERVDAYFRQAKPEYVFLAAAKVGGILANRDYPAEFIYDNLMIQTNIIDAAYRNGVKKLLFLGSSCIYPKFPKIPITEDQLMTSPLEESNSAYAIAKITGMRMCQAYKEQYGLNAISLMPTNLYGINDNFDLENSHVLPAMIRKFHEAEEKVTLWGDGSAMREFLHVDDLAEACYVCMQKYEDDEHINVGTGEDVTIKELAETVAKVVGNKSIEWDTSKPNGTPRKVLNVDKIKSLGWEPKISLEEGIESTYEWYKENLL